MRFASLAGGLVVLLSGAALAAVGDSLVVTGDGVNVRAAPRPNAKVVRQVYRNDPAVELGREGEWVEVRLPDRDTTGWIHGSLLVPAGRAARPVAAVAEPAPLPAPPVLPPAPAPLPVVQPQPELPAPVGASRAPEPGQLAAVGSAAGADAVARFRESVTYLNNRAVAAAGIDLFTDVRGLGNGVVQVTATDAWTHIRDDGQQSYMNTLFDRWLAAAGAAQPVRIQVVDKTGHVLKEKSGP